jgi:sorting nexin-29
MCKSSTYFPLKNIHRETWICLHKKGNKLDCENYRGIALLGVVYKLMCVIVAKMLPDYTKQLLGEYQNGFWKSRSTADHIFSIRMYLEKCYEHDIDLYNLFIDFKLAYDNACRGQLFQIIREFGILNKLVNVVKMTLEGSKCRVKVQGSLSQYFTIRNGLRQGDPLSTVLFNIVLEKSVREIEINPNGSLYNKLYQHLAFEDYVIMIARNPTAIRDAFGIIETTAKRLGLKINDDKTKFMINTPHEQSLPEAFEIGDHSFERTDSFKYLGAVVTTKNEVSTEIQARTASGNGCYFALQRILKSKSISWKEKVAIYKTIIKPIVKYASQTWVLTKKDVALISTWERKVLRKIFGPVNERNV